jgi:hypothetical protein
MSIVARALAPAGAALFAAAFSLGAAWAVSRGVRGDVASAGRYYRRSLRVGLYVGMILLLPTLLVDPVWWFGAAVTPLSAAWTPAYGRLVAFTVLLYPVAFAAVVGWWLNYRVTGARDDTGLLARALGSAVVLGGLLAVLLGIPLVAGGEAAPLAALIPLAVLQTFRALVPALALRNADPPEPDDDQLAVLAEAFGLVGMDVDDWTVHISEVQADGTEDDHDQLVGMNVVGVRSNRLLLVSDTLFEVLPADEQRVALARLALSARSWLREVRTLVFGVLFGTVALLAATAGFTSALGAVLLLVSLLAVPVVWVVAALVLRRSTYRHDDRLAEVVGADEVADVLETLDKRGGGGIGLVGRLVYMVPSTERRVRRLRQRAD